MKQPCALSAGTNEYENISASRHCERQRSNLAFDLQTARLPRRFAPRNDMGGRALNYQRGLEIFR